MAKFRKKPVVIEAVQFDGSVDSGKRIIAWAAKQAGRTITAGLPGLTIHTLEGNMVAGTDDWVIRGVQGEFYPCKPDIFRATYEAVEEE
uniref:Phage protein n=1 Tax=viral metagenome TaxID=1070528 RepID=A0A6H1Z8W7_9ZZZZ